MDIWDIILRIEHIIYCATNGIVELPEHKKHYMLRAQLYDNYLRRHYPEWFTDNVL